MPVETYHENGSWKNKLENSSGALPGSYSTKEQAVTAGKNLAVVLRTEHIIKNLNGEIGYRNSYGNDPYPPRG